MRLLNFSSKFLVILRFLRSCAATCHTNVASPRPQSISSMAQLLSIFLDLNLLSWSKDLKLLPYPSHSKCQNAGSLQLLERFHHRVGRWVAKTGYCYGEIEELCAV